MHIYFDTATYDEIERDEKVYIIVTNNTTVSSIWIKVTLEAQMGLIGGTMGLLTGFSILSGVEIIYYLIRLVWRFHSIHYLLRFILKAHLIWIFTLSYKIDRFFVKLKSFSGFLCPQEFWKQFGKERLKDVFVNRGWVLSLKERTLINVLNLSYIYKRHFIHFSAIWMILVFVWHIVGRGCFLAEWPTLDKCALRTLQRGQRAF